MTKKLPALPNQDKRLTEALRFHQLAQASAAQMAVAAAKCGLELAALKKEIGHGGWEEFFAKHFAKHGLQLRTAQKYMALAEGLKGKALKNEARSYLPLLECAPSELKKADQEKLTKAVAKMTDGATLSELYQEMGIVKKPQGAGAKGGNTRSPLPSGASPEPAGKPSNAEVIAEGHRTRVRDLITTLTEALADTPWNAADKGAREELHGLLVDVAAAVKKTL